MCDQYGEEDDSFAADEEDEVGHSLEDEYRSGCRDCSGTGYDPQDGGQCDVCYGTGDADEDD